MAIMPVQRISHSEAWASTALAPAATRRMKRAARVITSTITTCLRPTL
jgi:hypothetical protein